MEILMYRNKVWIGLGFTRDLVDPIKFGSAIRTRSGLLSKVIPRGSDPEKGLL